MIARDRTWIGISASAIRQNLRSLKKLTGPGTAVLPVIKANAYGHGLEPVANILRSQPIWGVGVAYGEEALTLLKHHWPKKILVLSYWSTEQLPVLIKRGVHLAVWDHHSLQRVTRQSIKLQRPAHVHIKIDTGTSRIGFLPSDIIKLSSRLNDKHLKIAGYFSHFASSEDKDAKSTIAQLKRFTTLTDRLPKHQGIMNHIACTAAVIRYPEAHFELIRPGLGIYGLWPSNATEAYSKANLPDFKLQAALTWFSLIEQVKLLPAGTAVGYGQSYRVKRRTRLAVIPVGYADGYDRRMSNRGWVMINGRPANILGRVCMNLIMVDVTDMPQVKVGQAVVLLGPGITADDWAALTGTINYEITTRLNPVIPRIITS